MSSFFIDVKIMIKKRKEKCFIVGTDNARLNDSGRNRNEITNLWIY
ncbi:MAG: hypothetical protein JWP12_287 [Bacteroidetes bacterium]|nr:hypothetical protein [Bacteroidota bacterium]